MKKVLSELFSSNKNKNLLKVLAIILLALFYLHYKLVLILEPSSFDMILELTVFKLAPILKSSIALNNYRPQLGQLTFLMTGELANVFGIVGGYVIRYALFILNLLVLLHVFKEFSENKKFNSKNLIFFIMTFGLTFFATIKYFYVVDFLTSLLFSFLSLLLILQNKSKTSVFICVAFSIYLKFSILLFLFPLLVIGQNRPKDLLRYTLPISLAVAFGLGMFLMKNVDQVLGQRGLFTILKHEGFLNFIIVNIFAPWNFFKFFDQSVATYSLAWGPYAIAKAILIFTLVILIFIKNKLKATIDFICVMASVIGIIAIQPYDPWFHDIGFYVGMIGLLGMFIAWKYKTVIFTKKTGLIVVAIFIGDFYFWNQSIKEVGVVTTKFSLQETLKKEISVNQVTDLYLYCMNNIGEFEWNLRGNTYLKIHYIVDQQDVAENLNRAIQSKTIWLFPKKCLHEVPPGNIGNKPSSSASFKREFYLNSMEHYRLYSSY